MTYSRTPSTHKIKGGAWNSHIHTSCLARLGLFTSAHTLTRCTVRLSRRRRV